MKKIEWLNNNKMKFESEFKTFNKATNLITTGNVISNTQFSSFISKDWPVKKAFPMCYLKWLPNYIKIEANQRASRNEKIILYCLKLNGLPVAWILTDYNHNLITCCRAGAHQYAKEISVLNEALKYLTMEG